MARSGTAAGAGAGGRGNASGDVIVGIDLGTTNSLVAVYDGGVARVIPDERGRALLPSVVRYESAGGRLSAVVGHAAREGAAAFPRTTVFSVKRLMGRSASDAAGDAARLGYEVVEGAGNTARVRLPLGGELGGADPVVSPPEVSAAILRALKERASRALGQEVRRAVVTVPAYFDDAQRQATRDAGRLAGLEVVRILNEPTAAALAYGVGAGGPAEAGRGERTVAVYDLGGGTFDISVLRVTPGASAGEPAYFQVLATAGDTHLGGDDVDRMLAEVFAREIGDGGRAGGAAEAGLFGALRAEAERVKCALSDAERATARVDLGGGRVYEREVTRAELEALMRPWVERTIRACERAVRDAAGALERGGSGGSGGSGGRVGGLDTVVLVGGATRTPLVRRRVSEFFGMEAYTALDPDCVVALGAAVQGAILGGRYAGALLLDVIPLSLGVETAGGAVAKLIMRNSAVPARAVERFTTSVDGQASIKLNVVQGEREMAADCRSLGVFHLGGLPAMPAGIPQVEVTFLVDANGVLSVSAVEKRSGRRASMQVVPNHGLTREEVDRMEAESVAHAREDMTRHRVVDLVAASRLDLKWIGEGLSRHGSALEAAYRADLERGAAALTALVEDAERDWRSVDADLFQRTKEALDRASVRLQEVAITRALREESGTGPARGEGG